MVPDPDADGGAAGEGDLPAGGRRWVAALRGGPAAQLRFLEARWRRFWQRPVRARRHRRSGRQFLL
eukprot:228964-Lingulodinium_polyedra.AAC.1